jgi:hypothetical protein
MVTQKKATKIRSRTSRKMEIHQALQPPNGSALSCRPVNVPRPNGRLPVSRPGSPIPPRPAAGRWEPRQAEMSAGQLQCLVRRRTPDPAVTRRASP